MDLSPRARASEKLRLALDLFEAGLAVQRAQLRRRFPDESDEARARRLCEWLRQGPAESYVGWPWRVRT